MILVPVEVVKSIKSAVCTKLTVKADTAQFFYFLDRFAIDDLRVLSATAPALLYYATSVWLCTCKDAIIITKVIIIKVL